LHIRVTMERYHGMNARGVFAEQPISVRRPEVDGVARDTLFSVVKWSTMEPVVGIRQNNAERAYALIRSAIIEGRYRPGQRIIEQRFGEENDLSRTPVREALRILEAEGLVISQRNRGAMVRPVSAKDIADLYELRSRLESFAAQRAAERVTPEAVASLDEAIAHFDRAIPPTPSADVEQIRALNAANSDFHGTIVLTADHTRLSQMLVRTVDIPLVFRAFRVFDLDERVRSNQFHRYIRDAVATGDAQRAGVLMSEHILMGRDVLLARMEESTSPDNFFSGAEAG
jgi:DNA-binding GntR family transcriptional regulator